MEIGQGFTACDRSVLILIFNTQNKTHKDTHPGQLATCPLIFSGPFFASRRIFGEVGAGAMQQSNECAISV